MMLQGLVITGSPTEVPEFSHAFSLDVAQSWTGAYVSLDQVTTYLSTEKS